MRGLKSGQKIWSVLESHSKVSQKVSIPKNNLSSSLLEAWYVSSICHWAYFSKLDITAPLQALTVYVKKLRSKFLLTIMYEKWHNRCERRLPRKAELGRLIVEEMNEYLKATYLASE